MNNIDKNDGFVSISKTDLEYNCNAAIEKILAYRRNYENDFIERYRLKFNTDIDVKIQKSTMWYSRIFGETKYEKLETIEQAKRYLDVIGRCHMRFGGYIDEEYDYHCHYYTNIEKKIRKLLTCCKNASIEQYIKVDTTLFADILTAAELEYV